MGIVERGGEASWAEIDSTALTTMHFGGQKPQQGIESTQLGNLGGGENSHSRRTPSWLSLICIPLSRWCPFAKLARAVNFSLTTQLVEKTTKMQYIQYQPAESKRRRGRHSDPMVVAAFSTYRGLFKGLISIQYIDFGFNIFFFHNMKTKDMRVPCVLKRQPVVYPLCMWESTPRKILVA